MKNNQDIPESSFPFEVYKHVTVFSRESRLDDRVESVCIITMKWYFSTHFVKTFLYIITYLKQFY